MNSIKRFWHGFQKDILPLIDRVHKTLSHEDEPQRVFRGMAFPNARSLTAYVYQLQEFGFNYPQSFSTSVNVAVQFAIPSSASVKSVIPMHMSKAGYTLPGRSHGCLIICDGFRPLDIASVSFGPAKEEEVWLRSGPVRLLHLTTSIEKATQILSTELAGSGRMFPLSITETIIAAMRNAALGSSLTLVVLAPNNPLQSPSVWNSRFKATLAKQKLVIASYDRTFGFLRPSPNAICLDDSHASVSNERLKAPLAKRTPAPASFDRTLGFLRPSANTICLDDSQDSNCGDVVIAKPESDKRSSGSQPKAPCRVGIKRLFHSDPKPGERYKQFAGWVVSGGCRSQEDFRLHLKKWGEKSHHAQHVDVLTQQRPAKRGSWQYKFWCGSCINCCTNKGRPSGKGWSGFASYQIATATISIKHTPVQTHGYFDRKTGKTDLSSQAKHGLKERLKMQSMPVQDLLRTAKTEYKCNARERKLGNFARNFRSRHVKSDKWPRHVCATCDWQRLLRQTPKLGDISDGQENQLCVISSQFHNDCTVVVFCNPALVKVYSNFYVLQTVVCASIAFHFHQVFGGRGKHLIVYALSYYFCSSVLQFRK